MKSFLGKTINSAHKAKPKIINIIDPSKKELIKEPMEKSIGYQYDNKDEVQQNRKVQEGSMKEQVKHQDRGEPKVEQDGKVRAQIQEVINEIIRKWQQHKISEDISQFTPKQLQERHMEREQMQELQSNVLENIFNKEQLEMIAASDNFCKDHSDDSCHKYYDRELSIDPEHVLDSVEKVGKWFNDEEDTGPDVKALVKHFESLGAIKNSVGNGRGYKPT